MKDALEQIIYHLDELDKKLDLLMDYLGLEFKYALGEPVSITKCEKSAHQNLTKCDFTEEEE